MLVRSADGLVTTPGVLVWARRDCTLPALVEDGGPTWTWSALARAAGTVADRLVAGGLREDQVVLVSAPNGGAYVAALFGVWLAGGVPAPVSAKLPPRERDLVRASLAPAATVAAVESGFAADLPIDAAALLCAPPADPRELRRLGWGAPGIVLSTSGTTGTPKGVVHTVRSVWGLVDQIAAAEVDPDHLPAPVGGRPQRIEPKPMVHVGAILGLLFELWRGRAILVMPKFEPRRYAELVRENGIRTVSVVPSMLRMLLDADDVGPLKPPARLATTGTAPLPEAWREEFEARFGLPVQLTYGQTEVGAIAFEPVSDVLGGTRRPGSSGRVVPDIDVQIRDDDGRVLPVGGEGHIFLRSPVIGPAGHGEERAGPADGWLDTGDLGRIDEDRYIYVTGRARELIVRGGLKITPAEVENALLEHPQVAEAAVAARPDARLGEVPVAWVRVRGATVTGPELLAFVRDRLAAYKVPVAVHVVGDFPRTESGKIRKGALVDGT